MRVCLVKYGFYENAASLMQFASALAERGDEVEVIALRRKDQAHFEVVNGVRLFRIQQRIVNERSRLAYLVRILGFFLRCAARLSRAQLTRAYDVIHVQSVPDFLVFAALFAKFMGARVILDAHEIVPEFYAAKFHAERRHVVFRMLVWLERLTARFADHIVIPNPLWYRRMVRRSARPEKCSVIRYLPDPKVFYPRPRRRLDPRFLIVYPGTLNAHQGLDVGIRGFARMARLSPASEFHIYGEGPMKQRLQTLAKSLGLEKRVLFYDMVSKVQVPELMSEYDLAVVPKLSSCLFGNEAESTKIVELMALGVPVVVAKTRIDQFYYSDSTVRFFEPQNEEDLANGLLDVARNEEFRAKLAANGKQYFKSNNWDTVKGHYLAIVDRLGCANLPAGELADRSWAWIRSRRA